MVLVYGPDHECGIGGVISHRSRRAVDHKHRARAGERQHEKGAGLRVAEAPGNAFQHPSPQPAAQPAAAPAPAAPAESSGPMTVAQVQETIDALDMRFSKGEISEATYNRLLAKWEAKLKELGG